LYALFCFRIEGDTGRINAITHPRRSGAIVKNMSLMSSTVGTYDFGAQHPMSSIFDVFQRSWEGFVVTGPATGTVKFVFRTVQGTVAAFAIVSSGLKMIVVLSRKWMFGSLFLLRCGTTRHRVLYAIRPPIW
jgi:hypothetical protein